MADNAPEGNGTVTVIDGATDSTATISVGVQPSAIAVNPVTGNIYVANWGTSLGSYGTVTVIDGAANTTTTLNAGSNPYSIAVNPATDKIYVANQNSDNVTVIAGATDSTVAVSVGSAPYALAVNPVTNRIFAANDDSSGNVTVINGSSTAVRFFASRFHSLTIGYKGDLAVYSLNGRRILKTSFDASATKENILRIINKIVARGIYRYRFLNDGKIMDEGNFIVR